MPRARTHGSGQSCYRFRTIPKCEECKTYMRERMRRDGQREGTYRWAQVHDPNSAAYRIATTISRKYQRRRRNAKDTALLTELMGGVSA